jgi:hypothetical protein
MSHISKASEVPPASGKSDKPVSPKYTLITNAARFALGQIVATPGALRLLEKYHSNPLLLLSRHVQCDWGDLLEDDAKLNELALNDGSRIFSVYRLIPNHMLTDIPRAKRHLLPTIWIITNAANAAGVRDVTTLLLPEDY